MITTLAIKNYALIQDVSVDFNSGLTIITGETGAGKSILLGALSLLLGKRADLSSAKDQSKKCVIEAEFDITGYNLQVIFQEAKLDFDSHTIVRREILPSGKSRAFVNDTPVTVHQLQILGPHLVDIHSQHETLVLSSEAFQIQVIDALAGNESLLEHYTIHLEGHMEKKTMLQKLMDQKESDSKELDYNTFLYNELKEAQLEGLDQTVLEEQYETLNNAEEIQDSLSNVLQLLAGESVGAIETGKEARNVLSKIKQYSGDFEAFWDRLNSVLIELEDINESISDSLSGIDADPQQLFESNEKLQKLYKLQQKHTVATVDELRAIQEDLELKIESTLNIDEHIKVLELEVATTKRALEDIADQLSKKRIAVIPDLKIKLETVLHGLGLPNAQFSFEINKAENFRKNGTDTLELLFTANKGAAFGSLKKVASGGELSRIMLAVKAVLSQFKKLPTLIFDEIDTGVSGEVANKMASIMSSMSTSMQLLSITHLPQIAAKGEHHIKVYKEDVDNITYTRLKLLNENERIVEIAEMIGGKKLTDLAIAHAKELLN